MSEISSITLPDGNTYTLADSTARQAISASITTKTIPANGSVSATIPSSGCIAAFIFANSATASYSAQWFVRTSSTGAVYLVKHMDSSTLSTSTGTNRLTISNSASVARYIMFVGNVVVS